ncbi:hypothetical protein B0H10DRAFT_86188 [Mycena sp. CBHHK59/15]|nr:hypothetical protein B0H10DRAFT_86188 [Mycena sp. CBHHK59/15]
MPRPLTIPASGSGEEGPSARVETPPRARVSKPKPAAKRSRSKPAPPLTQDVDGSDEENEAPTAVPTTPVKKGTKRFRTPGAEPALPSPADKKRSRLKSPRKTNRNAAVIPKATRSSQQNARTAPKLASEEDDSVGSDVGPPSLRMGHNSVDSDDEFGGYSES